MWTYFGIAALIIFLLIVKFLIVLKPTNPNLIQVGKITTPAPPQTPDELLSAYRTAGLERVATFSEENARPCFFLKQKQVEEADERYTTKLGGVPDLPPDIPWPKREGKNLSFIAQLDLAELHTRSPETTGPLPQTGMLFFFYDAEQSVWGFDPEDQTGWRVFYADETQKTNGATSFPEDLPEQARFTEIPLEAVAEMSFPDPNQHAEELHLSDSECETVIDLYFGYLENTLPRHQLFGYPAVIQNEMELECQLASNGLYCGDSTGYNDPRAKELERGASDWRLLLQIDTDDNAQMMWGDSGRLYFWIRQDDLAAGRFENTWMILQCY